MEQAGLSEKVPSEWRTCGKEGASTRESGQGCSRQGNGKQPEPVSLGKEFGHFYQSNAKPLEEFNIGKKLSLINDFKISLWTGVQSKTCICVLRETLFIVAGRWKPHKCPSMDKQVSKIWSP